MLGFARNRATRIFPSFNVIETVTTNKKHHGRFDEDSGREIDRTVFNVGKLCKHYATFRSNEHQSCLT